MGAPCPQGLKPARFVTFSLVVQTANAASPVTGANAGTPSNWAVVLLFQGAKPGLGGSNTGTVLLSGGGIPDFPIAPDETGAVDLPPGFAVYLPDLTVSGANVGDAVTFFAAVVE